MKSYALFQQYIWLVNTIHRYRKLTLEEINRHWIETEMSEGLQMWQQDRVLIYYYIVRINIRRDYSAAA